MPENAGSSATIPGSPGKKLSADALKELRRVAKKFDDHDWVNGVYGSLDALIISYSTIKYVSDLSNASGVISSDHVHDWMMSFQGAGLAVAETISLVFLSLAYNLSLGDSVPGKKDRLPPVVREFAKGAGTAWQYTRDAFKGLKFAYKGIRSAIQLMAMYNIKIESLTPIIGLSAGLIAAINRVLYRMYVLDVRKKYVDENKERIKQIKKWGNEYTFSEMPPEGILNCKDKVIYLHVDNVRGVIQYKTKNPSSEVVNGEIELEKLFEKLGDQFVDEKQIPVKPTVKDLESDYYQQILFYVGQGGHILSNNTKEARAAIQRGIDQQKALPPDWSIMLYAVYSGLIDGLYTYAGVLTMTALSAPILSILSIISGLFLVAFVANRCYENYEYQQELMQSKQTLKILLLSKQLEEKFWDLQEKSEKCLEISPEDQSLISLLIRDIAMERENLKKIVAYSSLRAALRGLRSGVYVYSAVSAVLLATMVVCSLASWTLPFWLPLALIPTAFITLLAFVFQSWFVNKKHDLALSEREKQVEKRLESIGHIVECKVAAAKFKSSEERSAIDALMHVDSTPFYPIQEGSEVLRSFFSGLNKGQKAINFIFNPMLQLNEKGHYQETKVLTFLGAVLALVYAGSYGAKAFGKQFRPSNKDALFAVPPDAPPKIVELNINRSSSPRYSAQSPKKSPPPSALNESRARSTDPLAQHAHQNSPSGLTSCSCRFLAPPRHADMQTKKEELFDRAANASPTRDSSSYAFTENGANLSRIFPSMPNLVLDVAAAASEGFNP